jgi:hypothetical protein
VPDDPDRVAWFGPTLVALLLLAAGALAIVLLFRSAPVQPFAADHGVRSSAAEWVRCAVETIVHHPEPFAAQNGFEIEELDSRRLVVRSALLITEVQLADGNLHYWRFRGWHTVFLDCPGVRPDTG